MEGAPPWSDLDSDLWLLILAALADVAALGRCACASPFFSRGTPSLVERAARERARVMGAHVGDALPSHERSWFAHACFAAGRAALVGARTQHIATGVLHSLVVDVDGLIRVSGCCALPAADVALADADRVAGGAKLGLGDRLVGTSVRNAPICRSLGGVRVRSVACGRHHSLGLDEAGAVWAWGSHSHAPAPPPSSQTLSGTAPGGGGVRGGIGAMFGGRNRGGPARTAGAAAVGARPSDGQPPSTSELPWRVRGGGFERLRIVVVACAEYVSFAIDVRGVGYSWLAAVPGMPVLGRRPGCAPATPAPLGGAEVLESKLCELSASGGHALAVGTDGALYAWGMNAHAQLGLDPSASERLVLEPRRVRGLLAHVRVRSAAAGPAHSLVLSRSGAVYSFGHARYAALGRAPCADSRMGLPPAQILALLPYRVVAIAAGGERPAEGAPASCGAERDAAYSVVLMDDGRVFTMGCAELGGLGRSPAGARVPQEIPLPQHGQQRARASALAVGAGHTLIALEDGRVVGYGRGAALGLGDEVVPFARDQELRIAGVRRRPES
jgi:alpha-tubulin suppressor-like RCC1 family protein